MAELVGFCALHPILSGSCGSSRDFESDVAHRALFCDTHVISPGKVPGLWPPFPPATSAPLLPDYNPLEFGLPTFSLAFC